MGLLGWIYVFRCSQCNFVWQKYIVSSGAGGMGGRCPKCNCANVVTVSQHKAS